MELLYYWINEYKCIHEQGFNFSPEFNISMTKAAGGYNLSVNPQNRVNVFKQGSITNITAIVGENGTGKTTLLHNLMDLNCFPLDEIKDGEYKAFNEYKNRKKKNLIILRNMEGMLNIYTNIGKDYLCAPDGFIEGKNLFFIRQDNSVAQINLINDGAYRAFTKIYISNSYFDDLNGMGSHGKLDNLTITPARLSFISDSFYEFICPYKQIKTGEESHFEIFSDLVRKSKVTGDFQSICDIIFYDFLIKSGVIDDYEGVVRTEIVVDVRSIRTLLNETRSIHISKENKDYFDYIYSLIDKLYNKEIAIENPVYILKANLIFEWVLDHKVKISESDIEDIYKEIHRAIQAYGNSAEGIYFKNALSEIDSISNLLGKLKRVENFVPPNDIAYRSGKKTYKNQPQTAIEWKELISFIESIAKVKNDNGKKYGSFLLRYLKFDNLMCSSGERVFQNLMSWMYFLSKLDEYTLKNDIHAKEDMLICMDEVDISLHPAWQRDLIGNMINLISKCYSDKRVQIVLTTHSPLCLSNIPRDNIVYLKKTDNGTLVDDDEHIETFGANLYEILDDAYYLDSNMVGNFAREYIRNIINEIQLLTYLDEKKFLNYKQRISCIGDTLIRSKLERILLQKLTKSDDKESSVDAIDKEIKRLEAIKANLMEEKK